MKYVLMSFIQTKLTFPLTWVEKSMEYAVWYSAAHVLTIKQMY